MTNIFNYDKVKIISAHPIFTENALVISQKYGIPIEKDFEPKKGDLYLVFGAHEIAPVLFMTQKEMNNEFGYIIYNTEQLSSIHWKDKYYIELCRSNVLFNYSNTLAYEISKRYKISPYSFFFFDYFIWDKTSLEETEHYDIVFVGSKSDDREKIHQGLKNKFPEKKILFHYDNEYTSPQKLTTLLMNSDIVLNIPYYKNGVLETHRIHKALACDCDVISYYSGDDDMNEFYKDYVYFTNNIVKFIETKYEAKQKKKWDELSVSLSKKFYQHNVVIIKEVIEKLKNKN